MINVFNRKSTAQKRIAALAAAVVLSAFCTLSPLTALAAPGDERSITMAINESTAVVNGVECEITAPVLAFNKTYVDLCAVAPLLGIELEWVSAEQGFFKASTQESTADLCYIAQWSDLVSAEHKLFVKDGVTLASVRELACLADLSIGYDGGIITVGNAAVSDAFENVNVYSVDDYLYTAYPAVPQYVVNPYVTNSYEDMVSNAQKLQSLYPDIIKLSSIGKSVENRDLTLIEFGKGDIDIFVCGTHHAREYMATTYLMNAIDKYAYAYRSGALWGKYNPREILNNVTFHIVPMVNPDGVNLVQNGIYATQYAEELSKMGIYDNSPYGYSAWKANVRGVDVNWNYDKEWSINRNKNPRGSIGFNGDYANSEPETAAVSAYVDSMPFEAYLSFHTQGEIFYWADSPDNPMYLQEAIRKDTGFVGHKESPSGVGGSFFDYVYRNFKKPTITVELCPYIGKRPYPDTDFDTVWKPAKNILLLVGNEIIYGKSRG